MALSLEDRQVLMRDLQDREYGDSGESWLDQTTIVAFSEFSRTALLNGSGGRDHSLTNACLIAGAGVRPGVYGASTDIGMAPQPMSLSSGAPSASGEMVNPEHIMRSLLKMVGEEADVADTRVEPIDALLA